MLIFSWLHPLRPPFPLVRKLLRRLEKNPDRKKTVYCRPSFRPQITYRSRVEIGWVYLPSQLVHIYTTTLFVMVDVVKDGGYATPTHTSLGWFYPHDGIYARKWPLPLRVLCVSDLSMLTFTYSKYKMVPYLSTLLNWREKNSIKCVIMLKQTLLQRTTKSIYYSRWMYAVPRSYSGRKSWDFRPLIHCWGKLGSQNIFPLKGVWHEIFSCKYFSWNSFPRSPEYPVRTVSNSFENSWRYTRMNVYHQCQRHRR
jgi:hypothetical protein